MKKIGYISLILVLIFIIGLVSYKLKSSKIQQKPLTEKEETRVATCPKNENKYYTFLPDVMLGKNIVKTLSQFIKMFVRPIKEMFVPLVNVITDTSKILPTNSYIIGNINQTGINAISNANLDTKNGGTTCTSALPNKIYFELKTTTKSVIDFCNLSYNQFYPSTKNVSINVGDNINQNIVSIAPNNVNTCIYDIMYNYNGNIPYGKVGRYIVIYFGAMNRNEYYLNLAELTAYDITGKIISLNKPVTMSSTMSGYPGSNLVDGNISTICHTNNLCPWLFIDLGSDIRLSRIVITNRQDCCQNRIIGFRLGLVPSSNYSSMMTYLQTPRKYTSTDGVTTTTYTTIIIPSTLLAYTTTFTTSLLSYTFNL
jgi:hypothetical protein